MRFLLRDCTMNPSEPRWPFLLALGWMTVAVWPGFGQNPSHGPIPGSSPSANRAQLQQLTERFQNAQQQAWLEELIQKSRSSATSLLEDLQDPEQRKRLEVLTHDIQDEKINLKPEDAQNLKALLEKLNQGGKPGIKFDPDLDRRLTELTAVLGQIRPKGAEDPAGSVHSDSGAPSWPKDSGESKPLESPSKPNGASQPVVRPVPPPARLPDLPNQSHSWLARVEKWIGNNRTFQNSPAMHRVLEDLAHAKFQVDAGGAGTGVPSFGEKAAQWIGDRVPSERIWTDSVMSRVRDIPLPSFPNVDLPHLRFSTPSLPSLDVPSVSMPAPSSSRGETVFFSVFTVAVVALVLWKLYGSLLSRKARRQGPDWALGGAASISARRLDLSSLRSREDLIRAFEQLSLVKLGSAARSWNHLHLAAGLGGNENGRRRLADHLAFLYEQARYAPGDGCVSPDALQIAHRELAILAGVANT
jgi:hypothetical protein